MSDSGMTRVTDKTIGQILIENGIITNEQLQEALAYGREQDLRLGTVLVDLGFISRDHMYWALGVQYGVSQVEIDPAMVDRELLSRFPQKLLQHHHLLPLIDNGEEVVVVTSDPLDVDGFKALAKACPNKKISLQLANRQHIESALEQLFPAWQDEKRMGTVSRVDDAESVDRPGSLATEEGVKWMLARAIGASADLVIARQGSANCAALLVGQGRPAVLCEFERSVYEGIMDLLLEHALPWEPAMAGQWHLPGRTEYKGKYYLVCLSSIQAAGALGLKLRPLRTTASAFSWIEEYRCEERVEKIVYGAAHLACQRLGLVVTAPGVDWEQVLYCYLQGLSRELFNVLFVSETARFALPSVYQYPSSGEMRFGALGSLAAYTSASHLVLDRPLSMDELLNIRAFCPLLLGVTALFRAQDQDGNGGRRLPSSFWELLDSNKEAIVLVATASGVERLTAPDAMKILSDWR